MNCVQGVYIEIYGTEAYSVEPEDVFCTTPELLDKLFCTPASQM